RVGRRRGDGRLGRNARLNAWFAAIERPERSPCPRGCCSVNGHVRCQAFHATWPRAVAESTNNKAREEQLETRLVEAAQDYLACKVIPVALVQLPGSRPPTFVVI